MRVKRHDIKCKHNICPFGVSLYPDDDKDYEFLEKLSDVLVRKDGHKLEVLVTPNGEAFLCFQLSALCPCTGCEHYEG